MYSSKRTVKGDTFNMCSLYSDIKKKVPLILFSVVLAVTMQ